MSALFVVRTDRMATRQHKSHGVWLHKASCAHCVCAHDRADGWCRELMRAFQLERFQGADCVMRVQAQKPALQHAWVQLLLASVGWWRSECSHAVQCVSSG
jgi:hypothetical protein